MFKYVMDLEPVSNRSELGVQVNYAAEAARGFMAGIGYPIDSDDPRSPANRAELVLRELASNAMEYDPAGETSIEMRGDRYRLFFRIRDRSDTFFDTARYGKEGSRDVTSSLVAELVRSIVRHRRRKREEGGAGLGCRISYALADGIRTRRWHDGEESGNETVFVINRNQEPE